MNNMAEICMLKDISRECGGLVQTYRSEQFPVKVIYLCGNHYHWVRDSLAEKKW